MDTWQLIAVVLISVIVPVLCILPASFCFYVVKHYRREQQTRAQVSAPRELENSESENTIELTDLERNRRPHGLASIGRTPGRADLLDDDANQLEFKNPLHHGGVQGKAFNSKWTVYESPRKILLVSLLLSIVFIITKFEVGVTLDCRSALRKRATFETVLPRMYTLDPKVNLSQMNPGTTFSVNLYDIPPKVYPCVSTVPYCVHNSTILPTTKKCEGEPFITVLGDVTIAEYETCCMAPCSQDVIDLPQYNGSGYWHVLMPQSYDGSSVPKECIETSTLRCSPLELELLHQNSRAYQQALTAQMLALQSQIDSMALQHAEKWDSFESYTKEMNEEYIKSVDDCEAKLKASVEDATGSFWDKLGFAFSDPEIAKGCMRVPPINITMPEFERILVTDPKSFPVPDCATRPKTQISCRNETYDYVTPTVDKGEMLLQYKLSLLVLNLLGSLQIVLLIYPVTGHESSFRSNKLRKALNALYMSRYLIAGTILIIMSSALMTAFSSVVAKAKLVISSIASCDQETALDECMSDCFSTIKASDNLWSGYCELMSTGILGQAGRDHCFQRPVYTDCIKSCVKVPSGASCEVIKQLWPYPPSTAGFAASYLFALCYYPQMAVKSYSKAVSSADIFKRPVLAKAYVMKCLTCFFLLSASQIPMLVCGEYQTIMTIAPLSTLLVLAVRSTYQSLIGKEE